MRRRVLLALGALALATAACGDDTDTATAPGGASPWGRTFVTDGPPPVRMTFRDGEVTAHAECNHLTGTAAIEGDVLVVQDVGGTEMGCDPERHAYDEWLAAFLESSPVAALDGATLTVTSGAGVLVLTDREVADPDRPLTGTRWEVDGVISGDAAASLPAGGAYLALTEGRVEGETGCNSFGADATVSGDRIELGPLTTTDVACSDAVMSVEGAMYRALDGEVTVAISADRLTLTGPGGHGLTLRAVE